MRETVLLINFQDKEQLREIQRMLLTVKLYMKKVEKEEYLNPLGFLAGIKELPALEEMYTGEELEKEMMVFAGVSEEHLNQMLYLMKKSGIKPVDYKAILTETNRTWTVPELYAELAKEHEAMTRKK